MLVTVFEEVGDKIVSKEVFVDRKRGRRTLTFVSLVEASLSSTSVLPTSLLFHSCSEGIFRLLFQDVRF